MNERLLVHPPAKALLSSSLVVHKLWTYDRLEISVREGVRYANGECWPWSRGLKVKSSMLQITSIAANEDLHS